MFNTEMIVKDMKGGKEDMTEIKRFLIDDAGELIDLNNHKFIDYGDECCKLLNELSDENEQLKFENNELKCALALDAVDYIIADGKKIDIPPYYEFEQRYDHVIHRKEYDGYD